MPSPDTMPPISDLADLLRFYAEAGVDEALSDIPVDRFAETAAAQPSRAPQAPLRRPDAPSTAAPAKTIPAKRQPAAMMAMPDEAQITKARELASQARTLAELQETLAGFDGCNLKFTAKQLVFGDGNPEAPLMLVGEAPGSSEDMQGKPFAGRSGQLFDRMLAAIGIERSQGAYIANVVPWRPPGNRAPTPLETEICRPFIERQIELVNPKLLVLLGAAPARTLLNTSESMLRLRGKWKTYRTAAGAEIATMPTLDPAYLLRNPVHKKLVWRDFLEIRAKLENSDS